MPKDSSLHLSWYPARIFLTWTWCSSNTFEKTIKLVGSFPRSNILYIGSTRCCKHWPRVNALKTRLSASQILCVPKYSKSTLSLSGRLWFPGKTYIRENLLRKVLFVLRNWFTVGCICAALSCKIQQVRLGTLVHFLIWHLRAFWELFSILCIPA